MSKISWRTLSIFGRTGSEYPKRSLAPRPLTSEDMKPVTVGLSVLLEEAVKDGTYPNGAESPEELAAKGLVK